MPMPAIIGMPQTQPALIGDPPNAAGATAGARPAGQMPMSPDDWFKQWFGGSSDDNKDGTLQAIMKLIAMGG